MVAISPASPDLLRIRLPHLLAVGLLRLDPLRVTPGRRKRTLSCHRNAGHGSTVLVTGCHVLPRFLVKPVSSRLARNFLSTKIPLLSGLGSGEIVALTIVITSGRHISAWLPSPLRLIFFRGTPTSVSTPRWRDRRSYAVVLTMVSAKGSPTSLASPSWMSPTTGAAMALFQKGLTKSFPRESIDIRRPFMFGCALSAHGQCTMPALAGCRLATMDATHVTTRTSPSVLWSLSSSSGR